MPDSSVPFPWWLWVLIVLWTGSVALQRRHRPPDSTAPSTGKLPLPPILISVYTAMIAYLAAIATSGGAWSVARLVFWSAAALVLCGLVLVVTTTSRHGRTVGMVVTWLGAAAIAGIFNAWELTLLCGVAGAARGFWGERGPDAETIASGRESMLPGRDHWLAVTTAAAIGVLVLGSVQYAVRVEAHRPAASRWYTGLPSVEQLNRWRMLDRQEAGPSARLDPRWLLMSALVGAAYWTGRGPRRQAEVPVTVMDGAGTSSNRP